MSNEDKTNGINKFVNSEVFNISKRMQEVINNPLRDIINNPVFEATNEALKPFREGFKITETLNKITQSIKDFAEDYERDKEAVRGNIYVNMLLNELESLEYQKEYFKKKSNESQKILKKLRNDIDKAISPEISTKENKSTKKKYLYKIDFEISKQYIQIIFDDINKLLFDSSNLYQWECILNYEPLPDPIKLKENTSIKDLRYFLDRLAKAEVIDSKYLTSVEEIKAFEYHNIYITAKKLKDANQDLKRAESKIKTEIDQIFKRIE